MGQVINLRNINSRITLAASDSSSAARRRANLVCSGVDASAEIQAQIDNIAATGGVIQFEDGTYPISSQLDVTDSNVKLRGRSRETIIKPEWNALDPLAYPIKVFGELLSYIDNCEVSDISFISEAPWLEYPAGTISVLFNNPFFQFCNKLFIRNVHLERGGFIDVRNCNNVHMEGISAYEASGPIACVRVNGLTIVNAQGDRVKAVVDLGEVDNATVTNIRGTGTTVVSGQHVKGLDIGGCTNITVSDFELIDFDYGVNIKYETLPCRHINISNGQIHDSENSLRVDPSGVYSGTKNGPVLINNVTIKNGLGVGIYLVGYSDNDIISNCNIETSTYGILVEGTRGTIIHDCIINSVNASIRSLKSASNQEGYDLYVHHNTVSAVDATHSANSSAMFFNNINRPRIEHNRILSGSYHGIWTNGCSGLSVNNNEIQYAWGNGIFLQWAETTYTDATSRSLDLNCNNNRVKGWFNNGASGLAGAAKAIGLNLTGISGAAYNDASICGNLVVGTTAAEAGIDLDSPVDLNRFIIANNILRNLSVHKIYRRGVGVLGAASQVRNNLDHITENSGTATIASGATTVVVNHGLASNTNTAAPTAKDIRVTPTNSLGNATKFWITSVTATQFTITVDTDPGATTATFAWQIQKLFGV